jgi:hypothetical protein
VRAVRLLELLGDGLGPVWGAVVDDYELPIDVAVGWERMLAMGGVEKGQGRRRGLLLGEGAVEEPCDDREVLALVEGRKDDSIVRIQSQHHPPSYLDHSAQWAAYE